MDIGEHEEAPRDKEQLCRVRGCGRNAEERYGGYCGIHYIEYRDNECKRQYKEAKE